MDKFKLLAIILIVFTLICFMVYIYNKHISLLITPKYETNNELVKDDKPSEVILYFFHVTWCPYSKRAKPLIENFEIKVKEVNEVDIKYKIIDGEKQEDEMNSFELKHNLKIDSFPTIYLEINNDVLEYNVKPDEETLMKFLETATR
jgi:glutaredoxin